MKTKVLLLGAILTAFSYSTFAGDLFLSPRAKDNQIKQVSSDTVTPTTTVTYITVKDPVVLSPRAKENQVVRISGTNNDVNPALLCQKMMTGSPKAIAECTSHTTMPGCQTMAAAPRTVPPNYPEGTTLQDTAPGKATVAPLK